VPGLARAIGGLPSSLAQPNTFRLRPEPRAHVDGPSCRLRSAQRVGASCHAQVAYRISNDGCE